MNNKLYEELRKRKESGEKLDWNKISKDELKELFDENIPDSMIAELYEISKSKVTYKRNKWNINYISHIQEKLLEADMYKELNKNSKNRLLSEKNIATISIALTHYLFRKGPVEDMHSEGKLSQKDMKTLNKYMVNRIAGLLEAIYAEDWLKLELILNAYSMYGTDWDKPIPDKDEIEKTYKIALDMS